MTQPLPPEQTLLATLAAQQVLLDSLLARLLAVWKALPDYHRPRAEEFAATVAPWVMAAQQSMSELTTASLEEQMAALTGEATKAAVDSTAYVDLRKGTTTEEVYQRPFEQIWYELSKGVPLDTAVGRAQDRLENLAKTDVQLAKTHTARDFLAATGGHVVGYRRVLTGPENCGLCVVASSNRYYKRDLMPIHPACDCAVAPIVGHNDPGQIINTMMVTDESLTTAQTKTGVKVYDQKNLVDLGEILEPAHEAIEKRFGVAYADARGIDYRRVILTHQHSELGPLMSVKSHRFSGAPTPA